MNAKLDIDPAFHDFESCCRAVLSYLHKRLGFSLWMVNRKEGENSVVYVPEDHGYGLTPGFVSNWADSFCSKITKGTGPNIAPSTAIVPAYAHARTCSPVAVNAYVGMPLVGVGGNLFGSLCAIDPNVQPESLQKEEELLKLLAAMLSCLLDAELKIQNEVRETERFRSEAIVDSLTGLFNRRGWDRLMEAEEKRCRRYGVPPPSSFSISKTSK